MYIDTISTACTLLWNALHLYRCTTYLSEMCLNNLRKSQAQDLYHAMHSSGPLPQVSLGGRPASLTELSSALPGLLSKL
ncbi:hypothetical protein OE88DRAFT_51763 [Heliocybe sulcata]|uniref:Uncharacterized protein n=1 Tax=Heliocybe sulcata TaxID=5364 RepID=A0A5C3NSN8_9AGAM|nr:hypothetical protein OE88DRAFT_51763 [Heliocybe sulcata]